MNRNRRYGLLVGLKILAICGVAAFMTGSTDLRGKTGNGSIQEETGRICQESVPAQSMTQSIQEEKITEQEKEEYAERYLEAPRKIMQHQSVTEDSVWDAEEEYLLAKIAMAEAEGEDVEGKALVILVVLNRVKSDKFPNSISEVIFQEGQFSPVGNGRFSRVEPNQECYEALDLIRLDKWDESQGALYFESGGKSEWHRKALQFLFQHGRHHFYTDKE